MKREIRTTILAGLLMLAMEMTMAATTKVVELGPTNLMDGFEATRVVLAQDGKSVALDPRVFKFGRERKGVVTTDPLNLGPTDGVLDIVAPVTRIEITSDLTVPEGSAAAVEARTGATFFDQSGWTPWRTLEGGKGVISEPAGRFVQVRITLSSTKEGALPAVSRVVLKSQTEEVDLPSTLKVAEAKLQRIVRSPIDFKYERPDHPRIVRFRKEAELDRVVENAKDDFEKLVRLMDWAGSCYNDRTVKNETQEGYYAWDIDKIFALVEVEQNGKKIKRPTVYGHCMSYAELLVTAATALGYKGRHMVMEGFREATHEVTDIWVPSLGKWVYFDPSLSNYYYDKNTQVPLNLIEIHKIVADNFVPAGKDMHWFSQRDSAETKAQVRKVGGKNPIGCRLGPWRYGEPMPKDYDWGWYHGYLAAGFVQMTPRNDFHSHPEANPKRLGHSPGYAGYPFWVDEKTPPTRGGYNWYTRMRDFYWTLDQAALRVETDPRTPDMAMVEFGNSMPFFKAYRVSVNGVSLGEQGTHFRWKLRKGKNSLEVRPVDEFGMVGLPSSITLVFGD